MTILEKLNSDDFYYADKEYLTNSALKMMQESPTKYYLWKQGKYNYPSSSAFNIGKAVHAMFLEGIDNTVEYSKRRAGGEWLEFSEENSDKIILSSKEYNMVHSMIDKLKKVSQVQDLMGDFTPEVPAIMTIQDVQMKGKADAVTKDYRGTILTDLKTCKSLKDFEKSAQWMGYDQQCAVYTNLFEADEFYFVAIEKEFPYEVGIYKASNNFYQRGMQRLSNGLETYKDLFVNGNYIPYSAKYQEL